MNHVLKKVAFINYVRGVLTVAFAMLLPLPGVKPPFRPGQIALALTLVKGAGTLLTYAVMLPHSRPVQYLKEWSVAAVATAAGGLPMLLARGLGPRTTHLTFWWDLHFCQFAF
jgi:hypothetical protein